MSDKCMACGKPTPIHKLDAKPSSAIYTEEQLAEALSRGVDCTFLACADCYGPGYMEAPAA